MKNVSKLDRNYNMKKRLFACLAAFSLVGCTTSTKIKLDPNNPVNITVWHYYTGVSQSAFDELCKEFNDTVGKEEGINVQGSAKGSISDLEDAVIASSNKEVGADDLPNIFSTYADVAYAIKDQTDFVDLKQYFTEDELHTYVDSFVNEGYITDNEHLYLFPIAKSTELFLLNKTFFEPFAEECNVSLDDLKTIEGVVDVSEKYYAWTDAKTPDILNDGQAFYGRDSMSNYFLAGMKQLGQDLYTVDNNKVTLHLDKDKLRKLWDNYYVPYVKGYFDASGKFRSDDVKTGDLLCYTGSSVSAPYFPDNVEVNGTSTPIEYVIMNAPVFQDGNNATIQQGAAMVVTKSTPEEEYASCVFLKWFTETKNNLRFTSECTYLPVKKDAFNVETFEKTISENNLEVSQKTKDVVEHIMNDGSLLNNGYTLKPFSASNDIRNRLDTNLQNKADKDKKAIQKEIFEGNNRDEVISKYINDKAFQNWYSSFTKEINAVVNG